MYISFGEILRDLREDNDMNQTELGKAIGLTQRKVSYLETGKCEPNLDDIKNIAKYFNISADFLLGLIATPRKLTE